jgi:tetratricopeptide (TPR) repeat protein
VGQQNVLRLGLRRVLGLALAGAALLLAACAKSPKPSAAYHTAVEEARAAERDRDPDKLAAALGTAAESCLPADCPLTLYRRGRALAESGDEAAAEALLRSLADEYPKSPEAPLALVYAAKLAEKRSAEEARGLYLKAISLDPDNVAADRAVDLLLTRAAAEGGPRAARAELDAIRRELDPKAELAVALLYRRATLDDELGDADAALMDERAVIEAGPSYSLYDDAVWRLSDRYLARGLREEAKALLKKFLDARKGSWYMGSLDSGYLDDAALKYGDILRDEGDAAGARSAYEELVKDFPTSTLRDDALFRVAKLDALPAKDRCGALARLAKDFPDSRHMRKDLPALSKELGCGG